MKREIKTKQNFILQNQKSNVVCRYYSALLHEKEL